MITHPHALPDDENPSADRPVDLSLDQEDVAQAQSVGLMLWGLMVVFQLNLAAAVIWYILLNPNPAKDLAEQWMYIVACLLGAALVPGSFHVRSKIFSKFWEGGVVTPREFVLGSIMPWIAITVTAAVGWLAAIIANSLVPSFVVPATMIVVMLILYPTGDAMRLPVGTDPDTDRFKHPY